MEDSDQDTDEKAPPLPGADALRQHIRDTGKSIPEWCEAHGIERISLQRLLKGERQRVSVELAFDLEEATGGAIEAKLWVPVRDVREAQRERRSAEARARARKARGDVPATGTDDGAR